MSNFVPYPPVKSCIYCGAERYNETREKLGEEHIIPLSYGGDLILPEASCEKCERTINREIEDPIASSDPKRITMFGPLRILFNLKSRRKNNWPKTLPLIVDAEGVTRKLDVDISDYPAVPVIFPVFGFPGILANYPRDDQFRGSSVRPVVPTIIDQDERTKRLRAIIGGPAQVTPVTTKLNFGQFARLLLKIAHSYTVAELGLGTIESELSQLILGQDIALSSYVGGGPDELPFDGRLSNHTHRLQFAIGNSSLFPEKYLAVAIHLFQHIGSPSYFVIVGKLPTHVEQWLDSPGRIKFREYMRDKNSDQNH